MMALPTYRKMPVPVEAIQFTGTNFTEIRALVGDRVVDGETISRFHPMGTFLPSEDSSSEHAELWANAVHMWLPVDISDWVVKDEFDIYPLRDKVFKKSYALEEDFDLFGDVTGEVVPLLDSHASNSRILGRIRMALLLTRPMEEVEMISNRLVDVFSRYQTETYDERTNGKVYEIIQSQTLGRLTDIEIGDILMALQNAGILFRELVPEDRRIRG